MKRENPENPLKTHREAGGDMPTHAHVSCPLNYYHSASAALISGHHHKYYMSESDFEFWGFRLVSAVALHISKHFFNQVS